MSTSFLTDGNASYTPGVSEVRSSVTTYSHSGLKNMAAQTDAGATPAVQATRTYDAFGGVQGSTGSWQGPFGTAGAFGYQSPQTGSEQGGLHLLGHRYYDATLGRFLTRDPIGDGSNWYTYCDNDPVGFADPSGLYRQGYDAFSDFMAGWGDFLTQPGLIGPIIGPDPYTKRFREAFGYDGNVEYDDGWYDGGWSAGFAQLAIFEAAFGGGGGSTIGKFPVGRTPGVLRHMPERSPIRMVDEYIDTHKTPIKGKPGTMVYNARNRQVREYGDGGWAKRDIDFKPMPGHPRPHKHDWNWDIKPPRGPARPLLP